MSSYQILHDFPNPDQQATWRDLLHRVDVPSHYNAPEYFLESWKETNRPFAVLALDRERVVGVLTGIHEGDRVDCGFPTRSQISFDKTADQVLVIDALVQGLLAESGSAKLVTVYSWSSLSSFLSLGFRQSPTQGVVVLDLTQGRDKLFEQLDRKRRNNIRSGIRAGVEVSEATTTEEFTAFYEIYKVWSAMKGWPANSFELELNSFLSTRGNRRYLLARVSGKIVAGSVIRFFPGGLVEYSRNHSLPEFLKFKPNDVLQWKAIEWACSETFRYYSLGGSNMFHREFGNRILPIYRYRMDRTWLRRHDLWEALLAAGRGSLHKMPAPIEKMVRRLRVKAGS